MSYKTVRLVIAFVASCFCQVGFSGDSIWCGGDGNWSDANWLTDGVKGEFSEGNRAVIDSECTITLSADTAPVAGILFNANAVIEGSGALLMDPSSDKAQTIEIESGVNAKISASIGGKVRKTGYGSLETTADKYNTLVLGARDVEPSVFEIGTGKWIISGGSTIHNQTPSTEGESGWYYFQGDNNSVDDSGKGAYIEVKDRSTLMFSRGKSAPWTCFGPRNKNGYFEILVKGGSTFRTQSDDFRMSSEQGGAAKTYFKMRIEDSTAEFKSNLNGTSRNAGATKIAEFINSDITVKAIVLKGPASRNSVTFDGATLHPIEGKSVFLDAQEREETVVYHTCGNGLVLDAMYDVTFSQNAVIDGDGGLKKTGSKKLTILAENEYTGETRVSEGELNLLGSLKGPIVVESGATMTIGSTSQGFLPSVTVNGVMALESVPLKTGKLTLGEGAVLNLGTYGNVIDAVSGYEKASILFDASGWPLGVKIFTSDDEEFLKFLQSEIQKQFAGGISVSIEGCDIVLRSQHIVKEAVWNGQGSDEKWSTAGNWVDGGVPNSMDWLKFTGSANAFNTNDMGEMGFQGIGFEDDSGPFVISGDASLAAPAWTNLSEKIQTFALPAVASSPRTTVHTIGDFVFDGGLSGSSAYEVVKSGRGKMVVKSASWSGRLLLEEGEVGFSGFSSAPLSEQANAVVVKNGILDIGGTTLNLVQSELEGSPAILQDGAVLKNGKYIYSGISGYNTGWAPGTITVGAGAILEMNNQLFDYPKTEGKRILRIKGGTFINSTNSERSMASGNTKETAFVLDIDGGVAKFDAWGYIYFGSRQGRRRCNETYIRNGGYLSLNNECRLGDYEGTGGSNVFVMEDSAMYCKTFNVGVRVDSLNMSFSNSIVSNNNVIVGAELGADPAKHSITFNNAILVSNENRDEWLVAHNNAETAVIHLTEGGVTMNARHNVGVKAVMDGVGSVRKTGSGTLKILTKQLYTGETGVIEGVLELARGISFAGDINVAEGATLSFASGDDDSPVVKSLIIQEGASLSSRGIEIPDGRNYVEVLTAKSDISLPAQKSDEYGNRFFVKQSSSGGSVLCYGRKPGFSIIVR